MRRIVPQKKETPVGRVIKTMAENDINKIFITLC